MSTRLSSRSRLGLVTLMVTGLLAAVVGAALWLEWGWPTQLDSMAEQNRVTISADADDDPSTPTITGQESTHAPEPAVSVQPEPVVTETTPGTSADLGGVLSAEFPQRGSGRFTAVTGLTAPIRDPQAPAVKRTVKVAVMVEDDLAIDGRMMADFVLATLNDPRSWAQEGIEFVGVDTGANVTVKLASPDTSAALCLPLKTGGKLSCRNGGSVILTIYRWVNGIEEYQGDLDNYRRYLVNHEVGHHLGKAHVGCPGTGQPAPVMQQQTKGLKGCLPNFWPYPQAGVS